MPVAAFAQLDGDRLMLEGLVGSAEDGRHVRARSEGDMRSPVDLGETVARMLLEHGAAELLAEDARLADGR